MNKKTINIKLGMLTLLYILLCFIPNFELLTYKVDVSFDIITFIAVIAIDNLLTSIAEKAKEDNNEQ